jgi:hypothetical protein
MIVFEGIVVGGARGNHVRIHLPQSVMKIVENM